MKRDDSSYVARSSNRVAILSLTCLAFLIALMIVCVVLRAGGCSIASALVLGAENLSIGHWVPVSPL